MRIKFTPDDNGKKQYQDLTPANEYRVIGIAGDDVRIMSDEGLPYLYPISMFTVTDAKLPSDWLEKIGAHGERYAYPEGIGEPGFFEDLFNGDREAWVRLRKRLYKWRLGED